MRNAAIPTAIPSCFCTGGPTRGFRSVGSCRSCLRASAHVAVDQRGFGDSDRPESGYAIPELGADLIAFLDALEISRATLVGHSFGSFVARQAAIAHPQRVAALALIGTGFAASTPVTRDLQNVLRDLQIRSRWSSRVISRRAPHTAPFRPSSSSGSWPKA